MATVWTSKFPEQTFLSARGVGSEVGGGSFFFFGLVLPSVDGWAWGAGGGEALRSGREDYMFLSRPGWWSASRRFSFVK